MLPDIVLLDRHQFLATLGIGETTRKRLAKVDPAFPRPVHIGFKKIAYRKEDVLAYINREHAATQSAKAA